MSSAAAAAAGAPAGSVFVKAAGARGRGKQFVKVATRECADVADLAQRIADAFPAWSVGAEDIALFLVPAESEDAVAAGENGSEALVLATQPLSAIKALSVVNIRDSCCLLARLPDAPAPAGPGECLRARGSQPAFVLLTLRAFPFFPHTLRRRRRQQQRARRRQRCRRIG